MDRIYYQEKRPEMLAFVPDRRATVLEIGCGDGLFAASIPETKEVWGIEPNKTAAEAASSRLYKVIDSTFEDASPSLPTRYFDLVIANDVIEHMADHDAFFVAIKRYIAHGGVLLGSIPNVRHYENLFQILFAKDWHYEHWGIRDRTHLRFFTEKSLRRSLINAGFHIKRVQGLSRGIEWSASKAAVGAALFAHAAIVLSLGTHRDIRHLRFAFVAEPR